MNRAFVLNRVIFELPTGKEAEIAWGNNDWPHFGGYLMPWWHDGNSNHDGYVINMHWPLQWTKGGPLRKTRRASSVGPGYSGAKEYQYFLKKYPFRDIEYWLDIVKRRKNGVIQQGTLESDQESLSPG